MQCIIYFIPGIPFESQYTLVAIVPHGVICTITLSSRHVTQVLVRITMTITLTRFTPFSGCCVTKCSRNAELAMCTLSVIYDKNKPQMHWGTKKQVCIVWSNSWEYTVRMTLCQLTYADIINSENGKAILRVVVSRSQFHSCISQ